VKGTIALILGLWIVSDAVVGLAQGTLRVSVAHDGGDPDGPSDHPSVSYDGQFIAFHSTASNLTASPGNGWFQVYVRDLHENTTAAVSVNAQGSLGNRDSTHASISASGQEIAFQSWAQDLVPEDTFFTHDVFVHDRRTHINTLLSVASDGTRAKGNSSEPAISGAGGHVVFTSSADNLVADDRNEVADVFVRERYFPRTRRVSVSSLGVEGDGPSFQPEISFDGEWVIFLSLAENLVTYDGNGRLDVFLHNLNNRQTTMLTFSTLPKLLGSQMNAPSVSQYGLYASFTSSASNLFAGDHNGMWDAFVWGMRGRQALPASVTTTGIAANGTTVHASICTFWRFIAFSSDANNLSTEDDDGVFNVFVRDQIGRKTSLVSVGFDGQPANGDSNGLTTYPGTRWMSAHGRFVAFNSVANNLVPDDGNEGMDVFVRDRGEANDFDADGVINHFDLQRFIVCENGPGQRVGFGCNVFDQEPDQDTDLQDFASFQSAFTGGY